MTAQHNDTATEKGSSKGWFGSSLLLWMYIGICALVLTGHSLDTLLNIRAADEESVQQVIDGVVLNHPAEISPSWAEHEVRRLRKFTSWFTLHTAPVLVWLILSFTQLLPTFRQANINRHKLLGYVMLGTSSLMLLGVLAMVVKGESIYGNSFSLGNPFCFTSWALFGSTCWLLCGIQGYRHGRLGARGRVKHKWYMYQFLATGYAAGTARLLIFAYLLGKYPKGGPGAMETPELNWLIDVAAWTSQVVNSAVACACFRLTETNKDKPAVAVKDDTKKAK